MENSDIKLVLNGLDCPNCARKIEERVNNLESVKEGNLNFNNVTLMVRLNEKVKEDEVVKDIKAIVKSLEPHVIVENKTNSKRKIEKPSIKIEANLIVGIILYILTFIADLNTTVTLVLYIISYLLIGGEVVLTAIKNISKGEIFDENFLMTIATVGAFAICEYPEAVAVMLFYQIGETIQGYAVNKSRSSISSLMDIRADYANLFINGKEKKVDPEEVNIGDVILIKPGEKIPLDGIVIEGESYIDTSALTGESVPRGVKTNDEVLSGCINSNGVIKVKVTKKFGESTVSRILEMVENAASKKAKTEKFISKFAKVYTPIVVLLAVIIAIVPPLVVKEFTFTTWIGRSLIFLVVSCPCALVVSVPLGFFAGIGGASKKGVLVKGSNYLELLKDLDTVVFDKTGTLTEGVFKVSEINVTDITKEEIIEVAALAESYSNHPIAMSIIKEYGKELDKNTVKDYEEISGHGIKANINDKSVLVGNEKLMKKFNIDYEKAESLGTVVYVAINSAFKGNIIISDKIKSNIKSSIKKLKDVGVNKTVMLTGDNVKTANGVAETIGIDEVHAELLPLDKVQQVENILNKTKVNSKVAFVGDGVNDAPVLARADIGIAMGAIGSDAAIEAADVVLMKDDISALVDAIKISKKTSKVLWQNIIFALGVKVLVMILGTLGMANMWAAVFADVGVTIIAVINSTRCYR